MKEAQCDTSRKARKTPYDHQHARRTAWWLVTCDCVLSTTVHTHRYAARARPSRVGPADADADADDPPSVENTSARADLDSVPVSSLPFASGPYTARVMSPFNASCKSR